MVVSDFWVSSTEYKPEEAVTESGAEVLTAGSGLVVAVVVVAADSGAAGVTWLGGVGPAPGAPERLMSSSGLSFQTLSVMPVVSGAVVVVVVVVVVAVADGVAPVPRTLASGLRGTIGMPA